MNEENKTEEKTQDNALLNQSEINNVESETLSIKPAKPKFVGRAKKGEIRNPTGKRSLPNRMLPINILFEVFNTKGAVRFKQACQKAYYKDPLDFYLKYIEPRLPKDFKLVDDEGKGFVFKFMRILSDDEKKLLELKTKENNNVVDVTPTENKELENEDKKNKS
jgi:hypothetical protein